MATKTKYFQKLRSLVGVLRDVFQSTLFSAMSNPVWMRSYSSSSIVYVNKATLSFFALVLAFLQCYFFYHAVNKNIDGWINTVSSLINAILNSTATVGGIVSIVTGVTFAAGFWFVVTGLLVGLVNQMLALGITLCRAFEASPNTALRKHYLQAATYHLFMATYLALTIAAMLCTTFLAVNPIGGTILCAAVVGLTCLHLLWRFSSNPMKKRIKETLHLAKPTTDAIIIPSQNQNDIAPQHSKLFASVDYVAQMKAHAPGFDKKKYLEGKIKAKLADLDLKYPAHSNPSTKIMSKKGILNFLLEVLEGKKPLETKDALVMPTRYPGAFQSFLREKGEVERLYDGVNYSLGEKMISSSEENVPIEPYVDATVL